MSTTVFPPSAREVPAAIPVSTDAAMPQYTRRRVFGIWAAAAIPMGTLAWVVAPFRSEERTLFPTTPHSNFL